jgi:glycosyltransferase involved in cell wall biosynthesis
MNAPLVSVVMPVRSAAECVVRAVESVALQELRDWELIAIDDGSADETPQLLRTAAEADRRIRLVIGPPQGIAEALSYGCREARGKYIARMDADDWMAPQRLGLQAEFLESNRGAGLVSCRVAYGGDATANAGYARHVAWVNSLTTPQAIALRRFVESPVAHPSVMFRREPIKGLGGYRAGDFPEDYELWLRWLDAGVAFAKLPEELLVWNDPPGRLSRVDARYRVEAFYRLKCEYLARWLRRQAPSRQVWLWGAGRITRLRFRALESHGIRLAGYIDIDPRKIGKHIDGRPVLPPERLPPAGQAFLLAGVGARGARELIAAQLLAHGWVEGEDFLLVA